MLHTHAHIGKRKKWTKGAGGRGGEKARETDRHRGRQSPSGLTLLASILFNLAVKILRNIRQHQNFDAKHNSLHENEASDKDK